MLERFFSPFDRSVDKASDCVFFDPTISGEGGDREIGRCWIDGRECTQATVRAQRKREGFTRKDHLEIHYRIVERRFDSWFRYLALILSILAVVMSFVNLQPKISANDPSNISVPETPSNQVDPSEEVRAVTLVEEGSQPRATGDPVEAPIAFSD